MPNMLPSHLTGAGDLVFQQWGRIRTVSGHVVLALVDQLPPVRGRYRAQLEIGHAAFNAGRAYEREVLGLPARTAAISPCVAPRVPASVHQANGGPRQSDRRRHLHLV